MPSYRVTMDDGSEVIIEAASPEEAMQIAAEQDGRGDYEPIAQTLTREIPRQVGLAGRYMAEGAADVGGILYNPLALGTAMAMGQPENFVPLREQVSQGLTNLGVPQPQGPAEAGVGEASRAVTGAMTGVGVGRMAAQLPGVAGMVGRGLAEQPIAQMVAAPMASAAAQGVREMGGSPVAEMGAGIAAGSIPFLASGGRGAAPAITREVEGEAGATLRVPIPRVPPPPPPPTPEETAAAVGQLIRTASTNGMGSARAVEELARLAAVNPEAVRSAERLGINLPPDVWSDHTQLREAIGLTRSVPGSVASAAWRDSVRDAAAAADEALTQIDSSPDLSVVSSRIRTALTDQRAALQAQARQLYAGIDERVPQNTVVQPNNVVRALDQVVASLGGERGLTSQEQRLLAMVTNPRQPVTYAALMREKQQIGRALERFEGPYADVDQRTLSRLYGALAEDQLATVERVGGRQLRADLRLANQTTAKQKALERRIVNIFGSDLEGSIATRLRAAITAGGRGDTSGLTRALHAIPPELRRQAIGSTIASLSRGGPDGGFGFAQYARLYQAIRANSETTRMVAQSMGPEGDRFLRDLYEVSRRVTDARANVITTGKANQALVQAMTAEGLVAQALQTTIGRRAAQAAATGAAGMAAGPAGAAIAGAAAATLENAISRGQADRLAAAGKMFSSPEFQDLVVNISTRSRINERDMRRLTTSQAFQNWARTSGVTAPDQWLRTTLASLYAQNAYQEPAPVAARGRNVAE